MDKHQYNVGDKVVVEQCTDNVNNMLKFVGCEVTIKNQTNGVWHEEQFNAYHIEEDEGIWFWREDWLQPATEIDIPMSEIEKLFKE